MSKHPDSHNSERTFPQPAERLPTLMGSSALLRELGDTGQVLSLEELQAVDTSRVSMSNGYVDEAWGTDLAPPPVETWASLSSAFCWATRVAETRERSTF